MKNVKIDELELNVFTTLAKKWALVTAGTKDKCNTMTVSWGGFGVFWNKNVATIYIRPQRYTKEFIDANEYFTISVLAEDYREALQICGRESGRDGDKFAKAGITPAFVGDVPYVEEAEMVLVCKKLCQGDIDPASFENPADDETYYKEKDYHHYYMAEIVDTYVK